MSVLARFRRKKEDPEVARRTLLMRTGRLGEATILGIDTDSEGNELLSYCYTVGGADYESVQRLDEEQLHRKHSYRPGSQADLKYDPRRPANSLVV
jgi:hypothetical protein